MTVVKGKKMPWVGMWPAVLLLIVVGSASALDLSASKICVKEAVPGTVFVTLGPQVSTRILTRNRILDKKKGPDSDTLLNGTL